MAYLAGQLAFYAIIAALIGGVIWVVSMMVKPSPPFDDDDDE